MNYGPFIQSRIDEWAYWISERESIRKKRESGVPPPWTGNTVMATTRWCNVRRMDDKVSKWLVNNWYKRGLTYRNTMTAALLARMINRPETLLYIGNSGYRVFDYEYYRRRMYELKESGQPVFTGVYIINGASGGPKIEQVLGAIQQFYKNCGGDDAGLYLRRDSMQITADNLSGLPGVGSFISGQVVADLRWVMGDTDDGWWADRHNWAPVGPGSSRGMRYLLGEYGAQHMTGRGRDLTQGKFLMYLRELIKIAEVHPRVAPIFRERKLEAHDIQNTLCETSKFIRLWHGTGGAKNRYDADKQWKKEM